MFEKRHENLLSKRRTENSYTKRNKTFGKFQ